MAYTQISQREARRLQRRVESLEQRQRYLAVTSCPGTPIDTISVGDPEYHIAVTARKLGFAVLVVPGALNKLHVYGVKP